MVKIESPDDSPARLKREDCPRTHMGSRFSKWQVLVGPSDWENYSLGNDGASRYSFHNLPTSLGPGLYELGIAIPRSSSGSVRRDVDSDDVVAVYVGQAENIRSRLQAYGRSGAHLGSGCPTGHSNDLETDCVPKGPGLFEETFKTGLSIMFRWAPVKDKRTAERKEEKLLDTFDYAWNKGGNGPRRPREILQKLKDKIACRPITISNRLVLISQDRAGDNIEIEASKLLASDLRNNLYGKSFLPGVFKSNRSQPRLVERLGINVDSIYIGGFTMNGVPCRMPPVPGGKRCQDNKGKRIYGSNSGFITGGSSDSANDGYPNSLTRYDQEHYQTTCGADLRDGIFCSKPPVAGRKRCEEHRGMKVKNPKAEVRTHTPCKPKAKETQLIPSLFGTSGGRDFHDAEPKIDFSGTKQSGCSNRSSVNNDFSTTCGATLENGSSCRRQPDSGNKRCWQHKGRRASSGGRDFYDVEPKIDFSGTKQSECSNRSSVNNDFSTTCGATLENGSFCRRQPVSGNKRCWQHKGRMASISISGYDNSPFMCGTLTCGAALRNGFVCMRAPVPGRKRCEQHKGMRASSSFC